MPGNPLPITLPDVGVTSGPEYATLLRAALVALIDDIEAKITPDELLVNADVDFLDGAAAYSSINLFSTRYQDQVDVLSGSNLRALYSRGGEMYWRDGGGNNVAITTSGAVAGAAGNISTTGSPAYASSGSEILWSGGDLEYRFKDGSGADDLANIVYAEGHIRNGANTLKVKTAVTTDYTITWPAVVSAANDLIVMDASGNISFTDTVAGAKTFSGNATFGGTVSAAGLVTLTSGATAAVDQDITISGTGQIKHGDRTFSISMAAIKNTINVTYRTTSGLNSWYFASATTSDELIIPLLLESGKRITAVTVYYHNTTVTNGLRIAVRSQDNTDPLTYGVESIGSTAFGTAGGSGSMTLAPAATVDPTTSYFVHISPINSISASMYVTSIAVTVDNV